MLLLPIVYYISVLTAFFVLADTFDERSWRGALDKPQSLGAFTDTIIVLTPLVPFLKSFYTQMSLCTNIKSLQKLHHDD